MNERNERLTKVHMEASTVPYEVTVRLGDLGSMLAENAKLKELLKTEPDLVPRLPYEMTGAERQSGHDRVRQAENLILQLPDTHEGRDSWLINFGTGGAATTLKFNHQASRAFGGVSMSDVIKRSMKKVIDKETTYVPLETGHVLKIKGMKSGPPFTPLQKKQWLNIAFDAIGEGDDWAVGRQQAYEQLRDLLENLEKEHE